MRFLLTKALTRFIRRTPWSSSMALLGVALGVTSIVSVHLISASVAQRLDELVPDQLMSFSHFLHRDDLSAADYFALRKDWRGGSFAEITHMAPLIDESVELQGRTVRVVGIDLFAIGGRESLSRGAQTSEQFAWHGVWLDASLSDLQGVHVNGVIEAPPGTLVTDIPTAQHLLSWPVERLSYVGIGLRRPWSQVLSWLELFMPGFSAGLPVHDLNLDRLADWQLISVAQQNPANQFGKSVLFNISALGALALLVAWFLIYQVAVAWLRRLWPVYERLHVIGMGWGSLQLTFVAVLSSLGLIAGVVGLLCGQWLAQTLYAAVTSTEDVRLALDAAVVIKAMGSALLVCVLGGWWAFRQTEHNAPPGRGMVGVVLVGIVVAIVGVLDLPTGLLGGFASIAALSLLALWLISPVLQWLKKKGAAMRGPYLVRLSVREAIWYPRDVGVALAGLVLAIATAIGVGLMVDSFRVDFSKMLDLRLRYDLVVRGPTDQLEQVSTELSSRVDVLRLQAYQQVQRRLGGVPMEVVATRLDEQEAQRYGIVRPLGLTELLLSEQAAQALAVSVEERVKIDGAAYPVAGVFSSFGDLQPRIIVDVTHPLAPRESRIESLSLSAVYPRQMLDDLRSRFPDLQVQLQTEIRRQALATFDQTFAITAILIVLAMLVASIGVYIAVTSLRLNKRGHDKLMTSMGISGFESIGMDLALGLGVGCVATLVALPLGISFGWILCHVINPRAFGWSVQLQLTGSALLTPVIWGLFAAALASVLRVGRSEGGVGSDGR